MCTKFETPSEVWKEHFILDHSIGQKQTCTDVLKSH